MVFCPIKIPVYDENRCVGLESVISGGDGYSIIVNFRSAHPDSVNFKVAYNIYYSSNRDDVYSEGAKAVVIDPAILTATLTSFSPGDLFYFSVRATEFDTEDVNTSLLPNGDQGLKVYSEGAHLVAMDKEDLTVSAGDIDTFPAFGIVQIGYELMKYTNVDLVDGYLVLPSNGRGYLGTDIRVHELDGYDGYLVHDPIVKFWKGYEEHNTVVFQAESRFAHPNVPCVSGDGYRTQADCITTDLSASDENQEDNPRYPFDGWHRTDPLTLLRGDCLDSYIGGEQGCADGYGGIGQQVRGIDLVERDQQRLEVLLETTGSPTVLFKRIWNGITCSCVTISKESPELRCKNCLGTGFIGGYHQFFNTRRGDRRIMVRFDPAEEDIKVEDAGLESYIVHQCWTLAAPSVDDRDVLIQYDEAGMELWRYEILAVTRNILIDNKMGRQVFKVQRIRKSSPIYMLGSVRNAATMPSVLNTSIAVTPPFVPHSHEIVINEDVTDISQINQTTSLSAGHTHQVRSGIVLPVLSHDHSIVLV